MMFPTYLTVCDRLLPTGIYGNSIFSMAACLPRVPFARAISFLESSQGKFHNVPGPGLGRRPDLGPHFTY